MSQKVVYEKFYVHEIAAVDLSKICFLKNAMKTCKRKNCDLNRDWITPMLLFLGFLSQVQAFWDFWDAFSDFVV